MRVWRKKDRGEAGNRAKDELFVCFASAAVCAFWARAQFDMSVQPKTRQGRAVGRERGRSALLLCEVRLVVNALSRAHNGRS